MRYKVSVLKRFRSESKMQFYATAQKLRKDIMTLLLKDFGVRSKVRQLDIETRRMTTDDRNQFLAIAEKYGITAAEAEFPAWLIDFERQSLADLTRRLVLSVTAANSIYPTAFADAELRRKHQDNAIATCYQLYQEIDFAAHILPVDLTKYMPLCDAVEYEIALLKGWRKSDNKRYRELKSAL